MSSDLPMYETLYGIYVSHIKWSYGAGVFSDTQYMLTKEYLNEGCLTSDYSLMVAGIANTFRFLYPHWIKKQYYIEGVVEGHISLACLNGSDEVIDFEVKLCKVDSLGNITELGTTGTQTINHELSWDAGLGVGDEIVIPFSFEITPEVKMLDGDRIFIELVITPDDDYLILYHSNDATWEDVKMVIPFRGI